MASVKPQAVSPLVVDTSDRTTGDRGGDESFDESLLEGMRFVCRVLSLS